jgi:hypothetical protein
MTHSTTSPLRGTTHLVGGGTTHWEVVVVEPGRRLAIELPLDAARLRFEMLFEDGTAGSALTQRVSLYGPNASAYLEDVQSGFGGSLREGMRAVRDRIDAAARGIGGGTVPRREE